MTTRNKRYELTREKFLSDDEFSRLEDTLKMFRDKDPRNTTLLWLAIHTGARAQEILNIRRQDLDQAAKSVLIRGLKDSSDREIPLPEWLFTRVMSIALVKEPQDVVFTITYQRFRQIWVLYRPTKKPLHALRHTFAVRLYSRTKDIKLVQLALGHRSFGNTQIYLQFNYSNQELRRLLVV